MISVPRLPVDKGDPLKTDIEASQKRLKAAFGDSSIAETEVCRAVPANVKDAYKGKCAVCGQDHGIASTVESQQEAARLFDEVKANGVGTGLPYANLLNKGNMFGVLICVDKDGNTVVLKSFSGAFADTGKYDVPGWSPPIPSLDPVLEKKLSDAFDEATEKLKIAKAKAGEITEGIGAVNDKLRAIDNGGKELKALETEATRRAKQDLEDIKKIEELDKLITSLTPKDGDSPLEEKAAKELQSKINNKARTEERRKAWAEDKDELESKVAEVREKVKELEATRKGLEDLKKELGAKTKEATAKVKEADTILKEASAALLANMAQQRVITNFKDEVRNFEDACADTANKIKLTHNGQCGWCAAPKLLAEAKAKGLTPVSMTEFWMGKDLGDKAEGVIVPSCDFCRGFIGFNLCGLKDQQQKLSEHLGST